jgi:hypothetical protein
MEKRYEGGWTVNMMADYCWMLKRNSTCVRAVQGEQNGRNFIQHRR